WSVVRGQRQGASLSLTTDHGPRTTDFFVCPAPAARYHAAVTTDPLGGAAMTCLALRAACILFGLLVLGAMTVPAQDNEPKYPHVNLATTYEFDPSWPKKPGELPWAAMSSIAVDAKDTIYLLTRSSAPVQVYDTGGKLLRS